MRIDPGIIQRKEDEPENGTTCGLCQTRNATAWNKDIAFGLCNECADTWFGPENEARLLTDCHNSTIVHRLWMAKKEFCRNNRQAPGNHTEWSNEMHNKGDSRTQTQYVPLGRQVLIKIKVGES